MTRCTSGHPDKTTKQEVVVHNEFLRAEQEAEEGKRMRSVSLCLSRVREKLNKAAENAPTATWGVEGGGQMFTPALTDVALFVPVGLFKSN